MLKFCVIVLILQSGSCLEIDEYDIEVLDGYLVEELRNERILIPKQSLSAEDHENVQVEASRGDNEVLDNIIKEDDSEEEEEDEIVYAGPVNAKGAVTIGANFGYAAPPPISYPVYTSYSPFPPYIPHSFFPPPFAYPMHHSYPYIPIVASFLPGMGVTVNHIDDNLLPHEELTKPNTEQVNKSKSKANNSKVDNNNKRRQKIKSKAESNNITIDITPVKEYKETTNANKVNTTNEKEDIAAVDEEDLLQFSDEDFTDYNSEDEDATKEDAKQEGVVFGGFLPASGSVKIAARF